MVKHSTSEYSARYEVSDTPAFCRAVRALPELVRSHTRSLSEEWIWMVPRYNARGMSTEPAGVLKLNGTVLQIESANRHALSAIKILLQSLVGGLLVERAETTEPVELT
jgi:hypothetical protein